MKEKLVKEKILNSNVSFFDYASRSLPDIIESKKSGVLRLFAKKNIRLDSLDKYEIKNYKEILQIADNAGEVCFFDGNATKVFAIGFPRQTQFALVRLIPRLMWFLAVPGILRRIWKKRLRIDGILKLRAGEKTQNWLVLEKIIEESVAHKQATLSSSVGVSGLIDFLAEKNVSYIVLRFFEKLPDLYREGGDLDILVSDEDKKTLFDFVDANPGTIPLDIYTVSDPMYKMVAYYPPPIAKRMLDSAVVGPGGAKVPNAKDAFLNMAYHCTYHKGFGSGVPSSLIEVRDIREPDNDYAEKLRNMAQEIGLSIDINLESLDEYLAEEGWRPKRDTLAKLTLDNDWVKRRFFSVKTEEEVGLGVFILKQKAVDDGLVEKVASLIEKEKGAILRRKILNQEEQKYIAEHLRGGNWTEGRRMEDSLQFLPSAIFVVADLCFSDFDNHEDYSDEYNRLRVIKQKIRSLYDKGDVSIVHATDNTHEALEYVEVCFPGEISKIKDEIKAVCGSYKMSFGDKFKSKFKYYKRVIGMKLNNLIIKTLLK